VTLLEEKFYTYLQDPLCCQKEVMVVGLMVASCTAEAAAAEAVYAVKTALVHWVNHPHNHHSHHPEVCYAHPAGLQEGDPQVYNPDNTYLDIFGTMFLLGSGSRKTNSRLQR
jgi:hypothetical protein